MIEKKIKINFSPLWENPDNKFIVRFNDLQDKDKIIFATRLKNSAPQYKIRNQNGPATIEEIISIFKEINPIIYSESLHVLGLLNLQQRFGTQRIQTMNSYFFKILCQLIYKIICLKKPLHFQDYIDICKLSSTIRNYTTWENFLTPLYQGTQEEESQTSTEEISLNDLSNIRNRTVRQNENFQNNETATTIQYHHTPFNVSDSNVSGSIRFRSVFLPPEDNTTEHTTQTQNLTTIQPPNYINELDEELDEAIEQEEVYRITRNIREITARHNPFPHNTIGHLQYESTRNLQIHDLEENLRNLGNQSNNSESFDPEGFR